MTKVGNVIFGETTLDYYGGVDDPQFLVADVATLLNCTVKDICTMSEPDDLLIIGDDATLYLTERGLYNILAQSSNRNARRWRRAIIDEFIRIRKEQNRSIEEQFESWKALMDDIYWDEDKKCMMRIHTVPGGDIMTECVTDICAEDVGYIN